MRFAHPEARIARQHVIEARLTVIEDALGQLKELRPTEEKIEHLRGTNFGFCFLCDQYLSPWHIFGKDRILEDE